MLHCHFLGSTKEMFASGNVIVKIRETFVSGNVKIKETFATGVVKDTFINGVEVTDLVGR